jgi:phosphatidylserine/phosphatidylglycerophosphate/cardiolipin synthase-like enzyme
METKATFEGIQKKLEDLIGDSKNSIKISVAWFTNKELLGLLAEKAENNVKVEIIISDDINNKLSPTGFINSGGKMFVYKSSSGKFLHEKFAIFDDKTVVTGSYNWTYSAEYHNIESVIISTDQILVKQFGIKFDKHKTEVEQFRSALLTNEINKGADEIEEKFAHLENDLEEEFMRAWNEAKKITKTINFELVLKFIKSYGAIGAAKRLMSTGAENVQSGFMKMWELGRLDLTFEAIITKPKFAALFDKRTVEIAAQRLKEFNYVTDNKGFLKV